MPEGINLMAAIALLNAYIAINGTDLSSYCKQVELPWESDDLDTTTFGAGGAHTRIGGLQDSSLSLTFNQDYANAALDSILWPLRNTLVSFEVRPTSSAASTSNPKYTGTVLINKLVPISGSVGDLVEQSVDWPVSGLIVRATA